LIRSADGRASGLYMKEVPPLRPEGIHYAQIGFGFCGTLPSDHATPLGESTQPFPGKCTLHIGLAICGPDPVDVSLYGHYVNIQTTPAMEKLNKELPEWSKGAEWAHFVSHLVNLKV